MAERTVDEMEAAVRTALTWVPAVYREPANETLDVLAARAMELERERDEWHETADNRYETQTRYKARVRDLEDALRWYDDHKTGGGSYDGRLFGDLRALASSSAPDSDEADWQLTYERVEVDDVLTTRRELLAQGWRRPAQELAPEDSASSSLPDRPADWGNEPWPPMENCGG